MEKVIQKFESHAEADRANRRYYHSLEPQERLEILLELVARYRESLGEAGREFQRVHRITTLAES